MVWNYNYRADGTPLSDYCTSIVLETEGGGGRDGVNVRVPGVDGERSGEKTHRAVTLALRTALRWTGPAGSVTHANGAPGHIHENLAAVKRLLGSGLVELARNDPEAGELRALVELLDDPVSGEQRHIFVWPLRMIEGSWYEPDEQEATGNPPIVVTRGNRRIDDMTLIFDEANVLTHIADDGTVSDLEVLDPLSGVGGYPVTVRTGHHKTVIRDVDVVNDDPYLCLDGSGGRIQTSHATAFDITNNLDLRIRLVMDDWTRTGGLIQKQDDPGDPTPVPDWNWGIGASGGMFFTWMDPPSNRRVPDSPALGFGPGTTHWLRVTKVGSNVTYYVSDDDTDDHTAVSWTSLAVVAAGSANSLQVAAELVTLGHYNFQPSPNMWLNGRVLAAAILNSTTVVANPIFTDDTEWTLGQRAGDQGTDGATRVWTLEGTASIGCPQAAPGRIRVTQSYWMRFPPIDDQGVYLDGTAATSPSTPDKAALQITGPVDVRALIAPETWGPDPFQPVAAQWGGAGSRSWRFNLITDQLGMTWSQDGTANSSVVSTVLMSFIPNGARRWVRFTHNPNNGAGSTETRFYTSDDGITWIQLGATITFGTAGTLFNTTALLQLGNDGEGHRFIGHGYYLEVRNGINGTIVASPDFRDENQGWTLGDDSGDTGTDGQANVWTLGGAAEIVTRPQNLVTAASMTVRWRNRWA